ncbi:hypothetical protein TRVA0_040S01112 [Trichomonascus vanleenenianus]|uniref:Scd5p n=1 Tax=Trichomonascus vanleenenianus TaxID=2268995 RepID=UPI003EC968AC
MNSGQVPPLNTISVTDLQLSDQELREYARWYTDLLLRKKQEYLSPDDVLQFLDNFGVSEDQKSQLRTIVLHSYTDIDPTQFYIVLRLASHLLCGHGLSNEAVFQSAPAPKPRSILSTREKRSASYESSGAFSGEDSSSFASGNPFRKASGVNGTGSGHSTPSGPSKMNFDMFKDFMLTGEMPGGNPPSKRAKKKRVTFSSGPPEVAEAAARSLDELMKLRGIQQSRQQQQQHQQHLVVPQSNQGLGLPMYQHEQQQPPPPSLPGGNEEEEEDVEIDTSAFRNVNIDSVLYHGGSHVANATTPSYNYSVGSNSPTPSPSPPIQQQQQQQQQRSQDAAALSKFVPLKPTPTGGNVPATNGTTNSNTNTSQQFLSPHEQFIKAMSPRETSPANNSVTSLEELAAQMTGGASKPHHSPSPIPNLSPQPLQQPLFYQTNNSSGDMRPPPQMNNGLAYQQQQTFQQQPSPQPQQQQSTGYGRPPPPPPPRSRPVPPPIRQTANSGIPAIPPPPPLPRRTQNPQFQQAQPPPPPPRARMPQMPMAMPNLASSSSITSLPGLPQPPYMNIVPPNQAQVTSAPDLLSDLKALQEEVDRLSGRR